LNLRSAVAIRVIMRREVAIESSLNGRRKARRCGSVCAIVINYFGAARTVRCLESLVHEPLANLVLVDNSADAREQAELARLIAAKQLELSAFPIHVMNNDRNVGFGRAVNQAIAADIATNGGHSYYLLVNNDAEASPSVLQQLLNAAHNTPDTALYAPRIRWAEDEVGFHWYQPYLGHVTRKPFPGSFPYLTGCFLLVEAALVSAEGLFDEEFFMYGEDILLSAKAASLGRGAECVGNVTILHEGSGSAKNGSFFYEYQVARGHVLLARKLARSRRQRLLMILGRIMYLGVRALVRAWRCRSATPIKAYFRAWQDRPIRPAG
jgi:N-acetylglucosaminyl-diphospho-decaprenol L-rhamnosyltransferase